MNSIIPPPSNDRGNKRPEHHRSNVRRMAFHARRALLTSLALLMPILWSGCQPDETPFPAPVGIDERAPLAVFPSDRFTVADENTHTGLRVRLPDGMDKDPLFAALPELVAELESLDGFGTAAPLWVRFDGLLDPASLPAPGHSTAPTAAIQLVDLEREVRLPFRTAYEAGGHTLFIHPLEPFRETSRYAVVLTDRLRDVYGQPLRPAETPWSSTAIPADLTPAAPLLINTFTTQSITPTMAALADEEHAPGPAEFPESAALCPSETVDHVAWMGTGKLQSLDLRTEQGWFPVELDNREPALTGGTPISIPYRLFIPRGAEKAATVVVQHGLANIKERALACHVANAYAEQGLATIAIDAVWHGERGPGGEPPPIMDNLRTLFGLWTDGKRLTAHVRQGRDAMRQTSYDHFRVAALIQTFATELDLVHADGSSSPDGIPDLSGRLLYNGASMGGIIGSMTVAAHPSFEAAVLNVPGGRLSSFLYESRLHFYDLLLQPLVVANAQVQEADVHRLLAVFQAIWDRADAINHAHRWWREPAAGVLPRSVLIQETLDDVIVPNASTRALARAGGLPLLTPALQAVPGMPTHDVPPDGLQANLGSTVTGGLVQFQDVHYLGQAERAIHGTMGHEEALSQSIHFLETSISQKSPVILRQD